MIPKKIHFYWGGDRMSFLRYMTLYSFRKYHPDWEINLIRRHCNTNKTKRWVTYEIQDAFNYNNPADYTGQLKTLDINFVDFDFPEIEQLDPKMSDIHISDILGWHLLATDGGIKSDMDILFTKSITPLVDDYNNRSVVAGIVVYKVPATPPYDGFPPGDIYPIGFLMGTPHNEFWKSVYDKALKAYDPEQYQSVGATVLRQQAIEYFSLSEKVRTLRFAAMPPYIVYPFAPNPEIYFYHGIKMLWLYDRTSEIPKSSIGVHWYGGDVMSQRFNNLLTDKNYGQFNNTICNLIKNIREEVV